MDDFLRFATRSHAPLSFASPFEALPRPCVCPKATAVSAACRSHYGNSRLRSPQSESGPVREKQHPPQGPRWRHRSGQPDPALLPPPLDDPRGRLAARAGRAGAVAGHPSLASSSFLDPRARCCRGRVGSRRLRDLARIAARRLLPAEIAPRLLTGGNRCAPSLRRRLSREDKPLGFRHPIPAGYPPDLL